MIDGNRARPSGTGSRASHRANSSVVSTKGFDPARVTLPASAGICAYDRGECTVTLALDSEDEVQTLLRALNPKNRVRLCDETA